ncbi:MAG: hypothetical protein ACYC2T_03245 [Bacillota bacterium]
MRTKVSAETGFTRRLFTGIPNTSHTISSEKVRPQHVVGHRAVIAIVPIVQVQ